MDKLLGILSLVLLIFSCTGESDEKLLDNGVDVSSLVKSEENFDTKGLISFNSEFIMEDGSEVDGYYEDRNLFIAPYTSYSFTEDTLRVSTLYEVNSCAETVGRIRFSNDSLFLLVEQIGNEACTSVEFRKYHYIIVKENINKYTVIF